MWLSDFVYTLVWLDRNSQCVASAPMICNTFTLSWDIHEYSGKGMGQFDECFVSAGHEKRENAREREVKSICLLIILTWREFGRIAPPRARFYLEHTLCLFQLFLKLREDCVRVLLVLRIQPSLLSLLLLSLLIIIYTHTHTPTSWGREWDRAKRESIMHHIQITRIFGHVEHRFVYYTH